jgi:hypothetical protein
MRCAVGCRQLHALRAREPGRERRRLRRGRPQLEVGRAPERQRACTEERAAQVRGAAAAPRDDSARRPLERCVTAIDDPCRCEHAQRFGISGDVQLETRRSVERAAPIGADLGAQPALPQEREGPPRRRAAPEIQMERPVAAASQMEAPGGMEERRQLRPPVAFPLGRDRRELLANVLGRDQSETPSSASSRRLTSTPALP